MLSSIPSFGTALWRVWPRFGAIYLPASLSALALVCPAAVLVINHRLFRIASANAILTTRAEKRRAICVDLAIGLGVPFLQMILQIVVEGHRFDIFEEIGCLPNTYNVPPAYPLYFIWPAVLDVITLVFSVLNIRLFWRSSKQLMEMPGSNKGPNQARYIRLIALSSSQIFISLPITLYAIYLNAHYFPIFPWISWNDTHFNYSHVDQYPSATWRALPAIQVVVELNRWLIVLSAFLFFAFFGFAEEARKHYRKAYSFASSRLRFPEFGISRTSGSAATSANSFGPGLKKGMATFGSFKDGFTALGSHSSVRLEATKERKASSSSSMSQYRLTSDASIFDGIDNQLKGLGFPDDEGDFRLVTAPSKAVVGSPVVSAFPVPPLPVANAVVLSFSPSRLNSPLPHRPTSSFLDTYESV
ncbi:pheromone A receptor-domain-containing protein [Russula earlei]|uniref:Pheromone A receptor-domain-containing protein n=1 Tax=Russula earlei TaxID=71964 RepID=A0ACC0UDW6_9AGAM|nr:pheromone A receptor-domain-containing protein [Russula earlei]